MRHVRSTIWRRTRVLAVAVLATGLANACSVTTPRNGAVALGGSNGSAGQSGVSAGPTGGALDGQPPGSAIGTNGNTASAGAGTQGGRARSATTAGSSTGQRSSTGQPGDTSAVGVTKTAITVSVSAPFGSAIGAYYTALYENGEKMWANEVNANGGIWGRQIVLKKVDNAGTDQGGVAACKQELSNASLVTVSAGPVSEPDCVDRAGGLMLVAISHRFAPPWKTVRAAFSSVEAGATRLIEFMRSKYFNEKPGTRIGLIYNVDDFQYSRVGLAYKQRAKAAGEDVVIVRGVRDNQSSFISEMQAFRDAGVQTVVASNNIEILGILRDAKAIGFQPEWTGYGWCADEYSAAGGDLMNGIRCLRFAPGVDTPAYQRYQQTAAKYGNSAYPLTGYSAWTYGLSKILGEILQAAGPTLDHATFMSALERVRNYDNGLTPPVAGWGSGRLVGSVGAFPVKCCDAGRHWTTMGPAQNRF